MNKYIMILGIVLIIIAIILGAVQHFSYNFYGDPSNKWYFYGGVGIIGLVGIILLAWSYLKK